MLIKLHELQEKYDMKISGILHVGAHNCEEMISYNQCGIDIPNTYWIEAMIDNVTQMKKKYGDDFHIYNAVIDEYDDKTVNFNITNNGQSSSILEFGSHKIHHPSVEVTSTIQLNTMRLDTLIEKQNIPIQNINFINLDIQGVELRALKSMDKYLKYVKYIYCEVNSEQVYKNCDQINEIDEYLSKHNFKRCETKFYKQCGWGDAFYIKIES